MLTARCEKCLYGKLPKIPASKTFHTDLAIVGEAPGSFELTRKIPFVGPAGQLLQKALEAAGLPERKDIFITNALLCLPPKTKTGIKEAIRLCRSRVIAELQAVQPRIVIALGNIAMSSIMNNFDLKITKEQGRILESPELPGVKIIPMLHPAAILRAPGDYKQFYGTMRYAASLYQGNEVLDPGVTEWTAVETNEEFDAALEVLKSFQGMEYIGADIETTGLDPYMDKVLVLGLAYAPNKVFVFPQELLARRGSELYAVLWLLWIWHNGKFDTSFIDAPFHHDTMLLSYCLNEQGGVHALEQLAIRLLGADPYKHIVKEKIGNKSYDNLKRKDLYDRVAADADYTRQSFYKLYPQVNNNEKLHYLYHEIIIPASIFLKEVQRNGIYINVKLLREFEKEYQRNLDDIQEQILDIAMPFWNPQKYLKATGMNTAPETFNPGSTYQVAWLLFDVFGLHHRLRGKKRSTDADVLEALQGQHPIIDLMLEYRSVAKELSTYILGVEERIAPDGRVHTTFKIHGTVTGRLSSSEPNVQNQPKRKPKVRNIFQAPEGKIFIEADYKGAELRVLAHMSKDPALMEVFMQGRDLHTEVQNALHIPRIRAKAVNFGIAYGRTEYSIAEEFEISVEEARSYVKMWFDRFPGAKAYMDMCAESVLQGKTLVTPFGRHRRFGLVVSDNLKDLQNEARNFTIQSMASDLTLLSAIRAKPALDFIEAKIINLVHDSVLVEVEDNPLLIKAVINILGDAMRKEPIIRLKTPVPFDVEFATGTAWGSLKEVTV